jgi:uncharacterized protein with NRDE domain
MCTVTFVPGKDRIWITSNRDEKYKRPSAIPASVQQVNGVRVLFPRDSAAQGTWIAIQENGNAAVLLNGAFEPHAVASSYQLSRGQVLLQLISRRQPGLAIKQFDLSAVEPFTLILWEQEELNEFRWTGQTLHSKELDPAQSYIWSSVTLYSKEVIEKREEWFRQFLQNNPEPDASSLIHFHKFAGDGNERYSLMMQRDNIYATVSITNLECQPQKAVMQYFDSLSNIQTEAILHCVTSLPS